MLIRSGMSAHTPVATLREWLGGVAYVHNGGRDLRLDLLRGFAVVAMLIDHIGGQSPLYALTGGDQFFTSAAEGFVTISGFVVGDVYRQLAIAHGLGVALRRLLERAWLLYLLAVGLTLVILPIATLFDLPWSVRSEVEDARGVLWGIFTLHQTAYLADVALLYALLLGIAPLAFVLLFQGRSWLVLGLSWGLWSAYQINPGGTELPWPIGDNTVFHFSAWQVLFFSAMVLGYHRDGVRRKLNAAWDGPLMVLAGVGSASLIIVYVTHSDARALVTDSACVWFAKNALGLGRIAVSAIVFGCAWLGISRFWIPLQRAIGWLLLPLGQNALFAYSAHVMIVLALGVGTGVLSHRAVPGVPSSLLPDSSTANALLQMASITIVWLAIRVKLFRLASSTWLAGPVPVMVAATLLLWANTAPGTVVGARSKPAFVANPLGTPIPPDQVAAIASEMGRSVQPDPTQVPVIATPKPSPTPRPVATPPSMPLPVLTATAGRDLPGQPWTGSPGPARATLLGSLRQVKFHSQALDRDMPYLIYLPPDYTNESKRYPVVYLLHGASQRIDEWLSYGVAEAADQMIVANQIRPMLLVMPLGDIGYWVNHVDDGERWGDYVSADLVEQVDSSFRTETDGKHRAIGGLSMGGYGALVLAFNNPERFHHVAANNPTLHPEGSLSILGTGNDYAQRDPVSLAATAGGLNGLDIWLDIGATDPWLPRVIDLDQALNTRGLAHTWVIGNGGHDGVYWQRNVPAYLRFYSGGFS
jgi:enterochelin esterase-like enzyme